MNSILCRMKSGCGLSVTYGRSLYAALSRKNGFSHQRRLLALLRSDEILARARPSGTCSRTRASTLRTPASICVGLLRQEKSILVNRGGRRRRRSRRKKLPRLFRRFYCSIPKRTAVRGWGWRSHGPSSRNTMVAYIAENTLRQACVSPYAYRCWTAYCPFLNYPTEGLQRGTP